MLIHGGSSGIGLTAIQLASQFAVRVFSAAASNEKLSACGTAGAVIGINYKTKDFEEIVKVGTGGTRANLILDMGVPTLSETQML